MAKKPKHKKKTQTQKFNKDFKNGPHQIKEKSPQPFKLALLRVSERPLPRGTALLRDTSLLGPATASGWLIRRSKGSGPVPHSGQGWGPSRLQKSSRIGCSLSCKLQINSCSAQSCHPHFLTVYFLSSFFRKTSTCKTLSLSLFIGGPT